MALPQLGRALSSRKGRPDPDAMTLAEHFGELRRRLIVSVTVFLVTATVSAVFYTSFLRLLRHPYCQVTPHACSFYVTGPLDPLTLRIKLAAFGGLVLASPVILWETWRFITPGLRPREKRYAVPFVASSVVLFLFGCVTAYVVFPHALRFLIGVGGPQLHEILNPNYYLTLIILLMVLFGATFEFPVVLVALQIAGVVSPASLLRWWRWAVIAITVGAAVFTPSSDPFSMLALAVPLVLFYFAAIGVGKLLGR